MSKFYEVRSIYKKGVFDVLCYPVEVVKVTDKNVIIRGIRKHIPLNEVNNIYKRNNVFGFSAYCWEEQLKETSNQIYLRTKEDIEKELERLTNIQKSMEEWQND